MLVRYPNILITKSPKKKGVFFIQINTPDDEGIFKKFYNNYN